MVFLYAKEAPAEVTLLKHPISSAPLSLWTDAFLFAIGSLNQLSNGNCIFLNELSKNQSNGSAYNRELLAIYSSRVANLPEHLQPEIFFKNFSLLYLKFIKNPNFIQNFWWKMLRKKRESWQLCSSIKKFRRMLGGRKFSIYTDQKTPLSKSPKSARLAY